MQSAHCILLALVAAAGVDAFVVTPGALMHGVHSRCRAGRAAPALTMQGKDSVEGGGREGVGAGAGPELWVPAWDRALSRRGLIGSVNSAVALSLLSEAEQVEAAPPLWGGVVLPDMGTGTWAWGDKSVWGYGTKGYDKELSDSTIAEAFSACIKNGVTLFDTAEVYGDGVSEKILGGLIKSASPEDRSKLTIATKYYPVDPYTSLPRLSMPKDVLNALDASLKRLDLPSVDLYQVHAPLVAASPEALGDALAEAVESGRTKAVGVSNYALKEIMPLYRQLEKRGVPLASNQIEFSLLRQLPESSGLIQKCTELGMGTLAYSPLAMGRLTGKYSASNKPKGKRFFSDVPMRDLEPLISKLKEVGARYGKTPAQVSLNWLICRGAVPIPGAKNAKQAADNAGALGWRLSEEDQMALQALGREGGTNVWQHDGQS